MWKKAFRITFAGVLFFTSCELIEDNTNSGEYKYEQASDYTWDVNSESAIVFNETTAVTADENVTVNNNIVTIKKAGNYSLTGTLLNGQLIVDADSGIVRLIMKGFNLGNTSTTPLYIKNSKKTIVVLSENTINTIADGISYSNTEEPNAAIFSNGYLAFCGSGTLTVKGNYNDGISSDDEIIIHSGTINVTAKDDGIRGKDYLKISEGNIVVTSSTGHAMKSDNESEDGYGFVKIEGGVLTLKSTSADGIHGVKKVIVDGGILSISATSSQGMKSDSLVVVNSGNVQITSSKEGVEAPYITINDGTLGIVSTDDGFNASFGNGGESSDNSMLAIHGGNVYINASKGDGLDSNGNISMSGGNVVVNGPVSQPEVGMDYNGTFKLTGGLLIVTGINSNMSQTVSSSSTQFTIKITSSSSITSSSIFHIQDESGNNLVTFKPVRNCNSIVFSSSVLKKNTTYSIYTGGTTSGTLSNGLYLNGVYSGGTLKKTFTVSSVLTNVTI